MTVLVMVIVINGSSLQHALYHVLPCTCDVLLVSNDLFDFKLGSEPEQGDRAGVSLRPQPRREKKKAEKRAEEAEEPAAPSSDGKIGSLHMDDLEEPPLSPTPDSQSSLDE